MFYIYKILCFKYVYILFKSYNIYTDKILYRSRPSYAAVVNHLLLYPLDGAKRSQERCGHMFIVPARVYDSCLSVLVKWVILSLSIQQLIKLYSALGQCRTDCPLQQISPSANLNCSQAKSDIQMLSMSLTHSASCSVVCLYGQPTWSSGHPGNLWQQSFYGAHIVWDYWVLDAIQPGIILWTFKKLYLLENVK